MSNDLGPCYAAKSTGHAAIVEVSTVHISALVLWLANR